MPAGVEEGIVKGLYCFEKNDPKAKRQVQLIGSGAILREVMAASELLKQFDVSAQIWSAPSFNELRREALSVERHNRLHPEAAPKLSYVTRCLQGQSGPVIAATDYMKLYADQIRAYVPAAYHVLGTDGFGISDTRAQLRRYFEVDARQIAYTSLKALCDEQLVPPSDLKKAMKAWGIDEAAKDSAAI
jgi:pyruvate dehydrogenase E1 component